jgi:hypothetical protein
MKYVYFVVNESGEMKRTTKKTFYYYIKKFCRWVTTETGRTQLAKETMLDVVCNGYNGQGVMIAEKIEKI